MDKIQKLFEGIDAKVLTDEVKAELIEAFAQSVTEKAEQKAQELFKGKEEEYAKALDEMIVTATKTIQLDAESKFNESVKAESQRISDAYCANVQEEVQTKLDEEIKSLNEKFNSYIEYAAQAFITENEPKWMQEAEVQKANKIQESFAKIAKQFGVELSAITEEKDDSAVELEKAVEANLKLQEEVKSLKREKLLDEAVKDLTAPQADKLKTLLEEVKFEGTESFQKKIDLYKSAIVSKIVEEKKPEVVEVDKTKLPSWKR